MTMMDCGRGDNDNSINYQLLNLRMFDFVHYCHASLHEECPNTRDTRKTLE